jgi:hypothetical protein
MRAFISTLIAASSLACLGVTAYADNAADLAALRVSCQQAYVEFQSAFTAWSNAQKYSNDAALIRLNEIAFWQADDRMQDLASQARKLTASGNELRSGSEPLDTTQARPSAVKNTSVTNP